MEYIDLLLKAEHWFLFFDEAKALKKAEEIERAGFKAKIIREKGSQWTVFELNN